MNPTVALALILDLYEQLKAASERIKELETQLGQVTDAGRS